MIHASAIIDPSAILAEDVEVGPFSIIGADVKIGQGTVVGSHVVIKGPTNIGSHNKIYQFSTLGEDTPDLKYNGESTRLLIGDHNVIREGVTIHRGTVQGQSETVIGDHNLVMAYAHVGHDSVIGNHCILVNNVALAGHVVVGDWAILSGYAMVKQYCSIGAHAFIAAAGFINQDVPAYVMAAGHPAEPKTVNVEGLKRRGFSKQQISAISRAYKTLYRSGLSLKEAIAKLTLMADREESVRPMLDSVIASENGIVR